MNSKYSRLVEGVISFVCLLSLSACQLTPTNQSPIISSPQAQEQSRSSAPKLEITTETKTSLTKEDLSSFLLDFENAYCDLKKIDFIFWQKYSSPKYQEIYIQPGNNDVPLMRWLGNDGLNYLSINNIQADFDKISNSSLKSEFSESLRLTNVAFSFLKKYLTTNSTLASFEQFRDEAGPSLSGFRETVPRIEYQLRTDYENFIKTHPDTVSAENEGLLSIENICSTLMPELTQNELKGVSYDENSQALTKIDKEFWQTEEPIQTIEPEQSFITVDKNENYYRSNNNAFYITGTTSSNCDSIEVTAINKASGINDKYVLTEYKKGNTTFRYGVREDWNNLGAGTNNYTFKASCEDGQVVQDQYSLKLTLPQTTYYGQSGLSNNNYYTNSENQQVHSPAYSITIPNGATAQCEDGTYSFSQSRSGTCSHHGGVSTWL